MRTIVNYLKPYKVHIIIAYILTFGELVADLIFPLILAVMINDGIIPQDIDVVTKWGIVLFIITLLTFIGGIINSFYASHISVQFAYEIRKDLFAHVQGFTFAQLAKFPSSALVTRFTNDVRQVQNTVFMALRIMARAPFLILGSVIMALFVNFRISFIFLFTVPLLLIFLYWILHRGSKMFHKVQANVDRVNRFIQENIAGMRTIRSFVQYAYENKRFAQANRQLAEQMQTTFRFIAGSMPFLLFGMNIAILFIIWVGHQQVMTNETNVGDVVAIINYALRTVMAITLLTFITLAFSRAKASIGRIEVIFAEKQQEAHPSHEADRKELALSGAIRFTNVSFTYPETKREILQDLSFSIKSGEKIAIMGATGSGKTTLFQLIPRLYEPDAGTIYIDEKPLTTYPLQRLREQISLVPQKPLLFTGTIRENITFGNKHASEAELIKAAKAAQIHETIISFPKQYDTIVGQRGVNLSGGQKQRISIARALIRQPKIILFDDSTSALDLETERLLLDALADYRATMLFITQKITTAKRMDRIMLLDAGKIFAFDTHKHLLAHSPLYARIVASQTEENFHAF